MRSVHSLEVFITPKHDDPVVNSSVCLRSFKTFNRIVERCVGWVKFKWCVRYDFRLLPAAIVFIIVDIKHIVSCDATKRVGVIRTRLLLKRGMWKYFEV